MEAKRTSVFENSLIWFGAGVSIAEILTGTYLAPLGFQKGLAAIIVGHVIGCALLFWLAGIISSALEVFFILSLTVWTQKLSGRIRCIFPESD